MEEDSANISINQAIADYVSPILLFMVQEIHANRQYLTSTNDRVSLALLMAEKTFLGDILGGLQSTSRQSFELPNRSRVCSRSGVGEVQDLLLPDDPPTSRRRRRGRGRGRRRGRKRKEKRKEKIPLKILETKTRSPRR